MTGNRARTAAGQAALIRLLRCLGKATVPFTVDEGEMLVVPANGGAARPFPSAIVDGAVSAGLVVLRGTTLAATPEAGGWLRRAMAGAADDAFASQHRVCETAGIEINGERHTAVRNVVSSPLAALSRLRGRDGLSWFPEEALAAAERLHADFHRGQLNPRMTARWEPRLAGRQPGGRSGMADITDFALSARERFGNAAHALGPELSGVAIDVCCFEKGLETVERERQWPARSAKLMLRAALMMLARHYDPPRAPASRSHSWKSA